jgi:hypothetical protein
LTGIHFSKDLLDKLRKQAEAAGLSFNAYMKQIAEKIVKGELVESSRVLTGEATDKCIYDLKAVDPQTNEVSDKCPAKAAYPELQKPENALILLRFCSQCSLRKKDFELYKVRLRYPTAFKPKVPEEARIVNEARAAALTSKQLLRIEREDEPKPTVTHRSSGGIPSVACDSCAFVIFQDHDADGLETEFINHISDIHKRPISQNEINQLKIARRRILGVNA